VAMSAVDGIPDTIRTEAINACIVLRPGFSPSDALAREIQDFVKVQLAAHEYPRFVQFTESLPMTATGKVLRRELRSLG
jgi:acetyl-CoA synthetase